MTAIAPAPMLIEQALPTFDAVRTEHLVVAGEPDVAYAAVLRADFIRAWRESAAVRALFGARALAEQAVSVTRRRTAPEPPPPASLRLADMTERGDWVRLGEDPPHELVFGVIGRFWAGETRWETIDAAGFPTFEVAGYARIACNFSVRPDGAAQSLVSYKCRTHATDAAARRAFLRYWRALSPFIGVVLRAQLGVIYGHHRGSPAPHSRDVERRPRRPLGAGGRRRARARPRPADRTAAGPTRCRSSGCSRLRVRRGSSSSCRRRGARGSRTPRRRPR
jgi:hypothetical protein